MTSWDESKHPRVPSGQETGGEWTEKVTGAAREAAGLPEEEQDPEVVAYLAAKKAALLPRDPDEEKRFEAYEKFHLGTQIRAEGLGQEQLNYEMASMINDKGEFVAEVGEAWKGDLGIKFSDDEVERMVGQYLIHNHPNDSGFSSNDLKFGIKEGLKGMVATGETGMFIVDFDREAIAYNPPYVSIVVETIFDQYSWSIDHPITARLQRGELTADKAMFLRGKEMMDSLNISKDTKDYIEIRFIPWESPYN